MRCEYGFCIVCDKEIAKACPTCNTKTPNDQYSEVELTWSNGSKMKTAVCAECAPEKIWKADKEKLTQAIWDSWDKIHAIYPKEVKIV